jgi:beta-glucosidase
VTPAPPPATPAPPATQSQIQAPTPTPTATPTPTPPDSGGAPVDDAIRGLLRERIQRAEIDDPAVPQPGGAPPRIDPVVDYTGRRSLPRRSAWRWTGVLRAPSDGAYDLRLQAIGHRRAVLRVDDRVRVRLEPLTRHGIGVEPQAIKTRNTSPVLHQGFARVRLRKGEQRRIELRVNAHSRQPLRVRLAWTTPEERREVLGRAVRAARKATAAVVFAQDDAGEAEDQPSLALPAPQDDLISAVARANRRTIVVLNTGGPVTMPWVRRVPSILEMWYPGERGAEATAQILLGRAAPGGKLPVTFPTDWRRQPTYSRDGSRYPGVFLDGQPFRTVLHDEGVFAGYRWYDAEGVKPLFAFGHGLSYTSFRYSGLRVARRGEAIAVTFTVENAGSRRADEVAQVYLGRPRGAPVRMPQRTLAAVRRLDLPAGRRRTVTVTIDGRWQSYWREATDEWVRPRGARAIGVGGASDDIRLRGQVGG